MNTPVDTINSAMTLIGGALALLAAIVAAVTITLPKEKTAAAIANLRAKTVSFIIVASAIASAVSLTVFDLPRLAVYFVFICASLTSLQFLRGEGPATRWETFMLVVQIATLLAFAFFYFSTRILSVLEHHLA